MMKKCLKQAQPAEEGRKEEDISQGGKKRKVGASSGSIARVKNEKAL